MSFQNFDDTVSYLYSLLPMYQRVGSVAFKKDLSNTIQLCSYLGNPEKRFKSIHVAGTNGKGSVSHMLSAVFQEAGYKTGLYTSPHLKSFTERIRVNGQEIDKSEVVKFVNMVQGHIEQIRPSFFELTVAMAFHYFGKQNVDVAIIEVGLGGRLDSTNVILPELSVITNIGMDHMDMLGDTLGQIAYEKGGIIKRDTPVVIGEYHPETMPVFEKLAGENHAGLYPSEHYYELAQKTILPHSSNYSVTRKKGNWDISDLESDLTGTYQTKNIATVLTSLEILAKAFNKLTSSVLVSAIKKVQATTGLKGRWQVLQEAPFIVCDTAHNVDGIRQIVSQLSRYSFGQLHIIWGSVKDKDHDGILGLLPKEAIYYFCEAKLPRALQADVLLEKASKFGLKGREIKDVNEAIKVAKENAKETDGIFIGGSNFVVAEINEL